MHHTCIMPRITVTISDAFDDWLEQESQDDDQFSSKADVMRHYVKRGQDAEKLEQELEIMENRLDDLRRQMTERENVEEKVDVLAKRVEERQSAADAPFFVRWLRWWRRREAERE